MARTLITGGTIFDGNGAAPTAGDLVIEGRSIVEVGGGLDGDEVIDATGLTVMPGFIDAHVRRVVEFAGHDPQPQHARTRCSTTWPRRTCGRPSMRASRRSRCLRRGPGVQQAVERGLIDGPALHISIIALSQTGGHGDHWLPGGNHLDILGVSSRPPVRASWTASTNAASGSGELIRNGANVIKVNTSGG